jgi:hypothetical protein
MILMSSEPSKAYQKLVTVKPSINEAANKNKPALITNEKRPRVMRVIGRVRRTRIGLKIALNKPSMTAAITAV